MSSPGTGNRPKKAAAVACRQQPARAVKRLRVEPQFPPEIWEHIFRGVPTWQLLQVRLICRSWNEVISGSPSLMDRFNVLMKASKGNRRMEQNYVPANLPPLAINMEINKFTIVSCDHWWPDYAHKLKELQFVNCKMTVAVFYGMLRQVPNLRCLILYDVKFAGLGEPDFRLERLESLVVWYITYEDNARDILDGFERVFPKLDTLTLEIGMTPNMVQSIRNLQNTLQYLALTRCPDVLAKLCEMEQLRLKMFSIDWDVQGNLEQWTRFCGNQSQLEKLSLSANCPQMLLETGRMLPKLTTLTLSINSPMCASFLEAMPGLEFLQISGCYQRISFANVTNPNLERFVLQLVTTEDLFQYLQRSPKLSQMRLNDCWLDHQESVTANFPNLTLLVLDDLSCQPYLWISLLQNSLNLEELVLVYVKYLDDDTMRDICKMLKRLKKLRLTRMRYITDISGKHILRYCRNLEELKADFSFSDEELDRIEAARKFHVKRTHVGCDDEDDDDEEEEEEEDE